MDKNLLNGRNGIITGASQGIGKKIAQDAAAHGASLVLASRSAEKLRPLCTELNSKIGGNQKVYYCPTDVSKRDAIERLKDFSMQSLGEIDFIVNCAGITVKKAVIDLSDEEWDLIMNVNLKSVFLMARCFGPLLFHKEGTDFSKFINFGSVGSTLAIPHSSAYCASKGGVVQLSKVLAVEWAKYRVNVNSIIPGYILTPLSEGVLKMDSTREKVLSRIPIGEIGDPADISQMVLFLLSQESNYITGTSIEIDGGLLSAAYTLDS